MIDSFTINIRSSDERKQTKNARSIEWHRFPPPWSVEELISNSFFLVSQLVAVHLLELSIIQSLQHVADQIAIYRGF
jgi:hypothetical protein